MSRFQPRFAVRMGQKARVALSGPSGSGKTYAGLTIAQVISDGGPVLVIDTERGSSALYSDLFSFEIIEWEPPYDPRELADEITARAGSYSVLMVDSLTHFWQGEGGTQSIVDRAAAKSRGNTYAGWMEGTPAQDAMVNALLLAPCHVIATMRSKTDYVLEQRDGKQVPVKVGMAPIQRPGIEFEFTVTCEVDRDHNLMVDKSRCIEVSDRTFRPSEVRDLASTLALWLASNEPASSPCKVCGGQVPGGAHIETMRAHMVDAHGWVRTDDGKVAPPPEDVPEPQHAGEPVQAAGSEDAPIAEAPDLAAPSVDPKVLERLVGRVEKLPDDMRQVAMNGLAAAFDSRWPDAITPADMPDAMALIADWEQAVEGDDLAARARRNVGRSKASA